MTTNGFLVSAAFARSVIVLLILAGMWLGKLQADVGQKADKAEVVRITQVLISINDKLEDLKQDNRQARTERQNLSKDVAVLMDKDE